MMLTNEQIDFIEKEQETLFRIIKSKPTTGVFNYVAQLNALQIMIKVHNIAARVERKKEQDNVRNKDRT